jgi:hypothetical protein
MIAHVLSQSYAYKIFIQIFKELVAITFSSSVYFYLFFCVTFYTKIHECLSLSSLNLHGLIFITSCLFEFLLMFFFVI